MKVLLRKQQITQLLSFGYVLILPMMLKIEAEIACCLWLKLYLASKQSYSQVTFFYNFLLTSILNICKFSILKDLVRFFSLRYIFIMKQLFFIPAENGTTTTQHFLIYKTVFFVTWCLPGLQQLNDHDLFSVNEGAGRDSEPPKTKGGPDVRIKMGMHIKQLQSTTDCVRN